MKRLFGRGVLAAAISLSPLVTATVPVVGNILGLGTTTAAFADHWTPPTTPCGPANDGAEGTGSEGTLWYCRWCPGIGWHWDGPYL